MLHLVIVLGIRTNIHIGTSLHIHIQAISVILFAVVLASILDEFFGEISILALVLAWILLCVLLFVLQILVLV